MSDIVIALRSVTFGYEPGVPVLRDVGMEVRGDNRIALMGRNGAGKTTLLHLLVGLLHPQGGHVEAFGQVCRREEDFVKVRHRVALLFQDSEDQLFCPTVIEDVVFGPLNLGRSPSEARALAMDALARVGMSGYESHITHHLSAGEKKLIALASILSMQPEVLLLDEPTAGLDEEAVRRIIKTLNNLSVAMLIASQDRNFLPQVTDRYVSLQNGRISVG